MSKRTRGTRRTANRPASTRPTTTRAAGSRSASGRPSGAATARRASAGPEGDHSVTEVTAYRAEEGPPNPLVPGPSTARTASTRSGARPSALLASKAALEYVYVAQDVRRIVVVVAALFAIMFLLWILIVVTRVIPI